VPSSFTAATASEPGVTDKQRVRFTWDEIPRLADPFRVCDVTELHTAPSVALCQG
jgi:hypothetical protein